MGLEATAIPAYIGQNCRDSAQITNESQKSYKIEGTRIPRTTIAKPIYSGKYKESPP